MNPGLDVVLMRRVCCALMCAPGFDVGRHICVLLWSFIPKVGQTSGLFSNTTVSFQMQWSMYQVLEISPSQVGANWPIVNVYWCIIP